MVNYLHDFSLLVGLTLHGVHASYVMVILSLGVFYLLVLSVLLWLPYYYCLHNKMESCTSVKKK